MRFEDSNTYNLLKKVNKSVYGIGEASVGGLYRSVKKKQYAFEGRKKPNFIKRYKKVHHRSKETSFEDTDPVLRNIFDKRDSIKSKNPANQSMLEMINSSIISRNSSLRNQRNGIRGKLNTKHNKKYQRSVELKSIQDTDTHLLKSLKLANFDEERHTNSIQE